MDKAYHFYLSVSNKILAGLLTLVGYSCGDNNKGLLCEYGSPHASYEIKGKVVDETGKTIPNIQITLPSEANPDYFYMLKDTLKSDEQGEFDASIELTSFGEDVTFTIKTEDIDELENGGAFEETMTEVSFKEEDLKDASGNWNFGNAQKEITITMKRDPLVCD